MTATLGAGVLVGMPGGVDTRAALAGAPGTEEEIYFEDFQDGNAENWESGYEKKFEIQPAKAGNFVLRMRGRRPVQGFYRGGQYWRNFVLRVRTNLRAGEARISFRASAGDRYFVGLKPSRLYLAKTARRERVLQSSAASHRSRRWYRLRIQSSGRRLRVYENGILRIQHTDRSPLPSGSITLESTGGSDVRFDDVKVVARVPFEHTWTGTNGPEGLGGGGVSNISIDPSNPGVVYASTEHSSMYRSEDGGLTWKQITDRDGLLQTKVLDVEVAPSDPTIIYVGHQTAGACCASKSTDGGEDWTRMDLPGFWTGVRSLAVHPFDADTVFAAPEIVPQQPGAASGLYRSRNGGRTWSKLFIEAEQIFDVAVSRADPEMVYAATTEGAFVSEDQGDTWRSANKGITNVNIVQVVSHPTDPNTAFARAGGEETHLFKTDDGGATWRQIWAPVGAVAVAPSSPETVYLSWAHSVWKSTDGGATFEEGPSLPSGRPIGEIAVDPQDPNRLYLGGEKGVLVSEDGGKTSIKPATTFIGDFTAAVAVHPEDPRTVYVGHGGGEVSRTADGGLTWTQLVDIEGAPGRNVTALGISPSDPRLIFAATLDGVVRSEDAGATWQPINEGLADPRIVSLSLDPSDPDHLLAGTGSAKPTPAYEGTGMYRSVDRGTSWTKVAGLPETPVPAIVFDPIAPNVVYASFLGEGMYKSIDGGISWTPASAGLESPYVYSLAIDPLNPEILYAGTLEYYGNPGWPSYPEGSPYEGLYKTEDGGASWGLVFGAKNYHSSAMIENVAVNPVQPQNVYITEHSEAVWHSSDGGSTWQLANQGLVMGGTHLYMFAMAISPDGSVLYMGNCGRGLYRNELKQRES